MKYIETLILIIIIFNFCFGGCLSGDDYSVESSPEIIPAEFVGGLLGGVVGFIICGFMAGPLASGSSSDMEQFSISYPSIIFAAIGSIFGCASGTCIVGSAYHQGGKFLPTLAGSALGLVILSPVGAVIGYNLSRESDIGYSKAPNWNRFELPSFCFRTEKTKENKIIPVYDFRLVNARF